MSRWPRLMRHAREEVLPFIERLHAELKMPIVYVSHNIDEICRLCDQLVLMDAGRVMTQGGLQSVLLQTEQPILSGKRGRRRFVWQD